MITEKVEINVNVLKTIKDVDSYVNNLVLIKFPKYNLIDYALKDNTLWLELDKKLINKIIVVKPVKEGNKVYKSNEARDLYANQISEHNKYKMTELLDNICNSYGIKMTDLINSGCSEIYVEARKFFYYVCTNILNIHERYSAIFVKRDRSTALYNLKHVSVKQKKEFELKYLKFDLSVTDTEIIDYLKIDRNEIVKKIKNDKNKRNI